MRASGLSTSPGNGLAGDVLVAQLNDHRMVVYIANRKDSKKLLIGRPREWLQAAALTKNKLRRPREFLQAAAKNKP